MFFLAGAFLVCSYLYDDFNRSLTAERLRDVHIIVTNNAPKDDVVNYSVDETCAYRSETFAGTLTLKCGKVMRGQNVIIQMGHRGILTLCEVDVYIGEGK